MSLRYQYFMRRIESSSICRTCHCGMSLRPASRTTLRPNSLRGLSQAIKSNAFLRSPASWNPARKTGIGQFASAKRLHSALRSFSQVSQSLKMPRFGSHERRRCHASCPREFRFANSWSRQKDIENTSGAALSFENEAIIITNVSLRSSSSVSRPNHGDNPFARRNADCGFNVDASPCLTATPT